MNTLKKYISAEEMFYARLYFLNCGNSRKKGGVGVLTEISIKHAARVQLRLVTLHLKVTVVKVIYSSFPVVQLLQTATLRVLRWRNSALCAKSNQSD